MQIVGLVGIYSNPHHLVEYTSNGEVRQEFTIVFEGQAVGGEARINEEASEVVWVSAAELDGLPMTSSVRERIGRYLRRESEPYLG